MEREPVRMGMQIPVAPRYRDTETGEILSISARRHPLRKFMEKLTNNFMGKTVLITVEVVGDLPEGQRPEDFPETQAAPARYKDGSRLPSVSESYHIDRQSP